MTRLPRHRSAIVAALLAAAVPAACEQAPDGLARWLPPVPGPIPAVVLQRQALPFCGVATHEEDPVLGCMVEALHARRSAELGIVTTTGGSRQVGVVRLLPDMTVELFFFADDHWRRGTCRSLREEARPRYMNVDDCSDPVEIGQPGAPHAVPTAAAQDGDAAGG